METATLDLLAGLNPEQVRAVTAPDGPILVIAGPGSGKTRVLTHRVAWLIAEKGVPASAILAVTFTNKAAREMRQRVEQLLTPEASAGLTMGTFHSFGVRVLRENPGYVAEHLGVLRNFTIYDDADQQAIVKQAISSIGQDPKQLPPRRVGSRISAYKSGMVSVEDARDTAENFGDEIMARAYAEYQRLLRKANAIDFDDLLILPLKLFDAEPRVLQRYQERFQYILVDEYQDTNRVQYVLVEALAQKHQNLFVVGDPDQSIYRWRQADIRNILDFQKAFHEAQRVDLEVNYRSTARIVAVADNVIKLNRDRIDRRLRTNNDDGEQVSIRELGDQQHEADFVVSEIRRVMQQRGTRGDDFAVMYRTTAQSRVLEEAFRVSSIPYQIVGGVRFYDRKEVKDVLAAFKLIVNPADTVSLDRVLENMPIGRGLGPKAMESIDHWSIVNRRPALEGFIALAQGEMGAPVLNGSASSAAAKLGSVFDQLRQLEQTEPLTTLFDSLVRMTGYRDHLTHGEDDELERWENVLEVRADMESYDVLDPGESLPAYLEQVALVADVDSLDDDSTGRVTLITLHSAKGSGIPGGLHHRFGRRTASCFASGRGRVLRPCRHRRRAPALLCRHHSRRKTALPHLCRQSDDLRPLPARCRLALSRLSSPGTYQRPRPPFDLVSTRGNVPGRPRSEPVGLADVDSETFVDSRPKRQSEHGRLVRRSSIRNSARVRSQKCRNGAAIKSSPSRSPAMARNDCWPASPRSI